jgi:lactate permease
MSGWKGLQGAWPAVLVCGGSFAIVQFLWSNYVGPELVDIMGGLVSLGCLTMFCTWWKPSTTWDFPTVSGSGQRGQTPPAELPTPWGQTPPASIPRPALVRAWMPWVFLSLFVTLWGIGPIKAFLNGGPAGVTTYRATRSQPSHAVLSPAFEVPALHRMVYRDYPVEVDTVDRARMHQREYRLKRAEAARFVFNWLSATGTAILLAALATALYLRIPAPIVFATAIKTLKRMRWPLVTIAFMLSLGFVTRYGGTDATLGLAFTRTGWFYPFFAALLGWLGVALTGSDTSSNVLFGSLQKITAQQLGLDPVLITTANSTGGVMGKMIDAQSIVIASTATRWYGHEGEILRYVFFHSIALACLVGVLVTLQVYVTPYTALVR